MDITKKLSKELFHKFTVPSYKARLQQYKELEERQKSVDHFLTHKLFSCLDPHTYIVCTGCHQFFPPGTEWCKKCDTDGALTDIDNAKWIYEMDKKRLKEKLDNALQEIGRLYVELYT